MHSSWIVFLLAQGFSEDQGVQRKKQKVAAKQGWEDFYLQGWGGLGCTRSPGRAEGRRRRAFAKLSTNPLSSLSQFSSPAKCNAMRGVNENQDNLPSPKVANPRYDWVLGLHCCKRFTLTPEVVSVQQSGKTNKTRQDILCHCLGYLSQGTTTSRFLVTFVSEEVQGKLLGPWTVLRSEQE